MLVNKIHSLTSINTFTYDKPLLQVHCEIFFKQDNKILVSLLQEVVVSGQMIVELQSERTILKPRPLRRTLYNVFLTQYRCLVKWTSALLRSIHMINWHLVQGVTNTKCSTLCYKNQRSTLVLWAFKTLKEPDLLLFKMWVLVHKTA